MRQRAIVKEINGNEALIEVSRKTMCDGCEKNGGCEGHCEITGLLSTGGQFTTRAKNSIGAKVGDIVEVETESTRVLGYAALVFILPLIVAGILYAVSSRFTHGEGTRLLSALGGFIVSFVFIAVFDRIKRKKTPDIDIVSIVFSKS